MNNEEKPDFFGAQASLNESFMQMYPELALLREELEKQDNRATSHPMFCVQEYNDERAYTVQTFFTKKAAEEYIASKYKYSDVRVRTYVTSGYYNPEWRMIREFLYGNKEDT